jgi:hypothetical protein
MVQPLADRSELHVHFAGTPLFDAKELTVPARFSHGALSVTEAVDVMVFSFHGALRASDLARKILAGVAATSSPRTLIVGDAFRNRPSAVAAMAQRVFAGTTVDLDIVTSKGEAKNALALLWAKLQARPPKPGAVGPRLADVPESVAATADLRDDTGRLHIDRIADVFGLTRAALARAVSSTPQAVAKTPNAESLQPKLHPFEEVARMRAVTRDDVTFRKWLNQPNARLGRKAPVDFLIKGDPEPVIAMVSNFLIGATT